MKTFIALAFVAGNLAAQSYLCGYMGSAVAWTNRSQQSCGLMPGGYTVAQGYTVEMHNGAGVTVQSAAPSVSGKAYCGGTYLDCGGPSFGARTWFSGGIGNWQVTVSGIDSGAAGPYVPWNGCSVARYSRFDPASPLTMTEPTCPCVSSTCGLTGCPACTCRTMCGTQCMDGRRCTNAQNVTVPATCTTPVGGGTPSITCPVSSCPLIVDTDGSGIRLTSAEGGRLWTFWPGQAPQQMAWIDPASRNAFVVYDRNGDGIVNDGSELFGNATEQPEAGGTRNGFAALAVFDANGDDVIDSRDAIWPKLQLMTADGALHPMAWGGVVSISLNYHPGNKTDAFGNVARFSASARTEQRTIQVGDWFLTALPSKAGASCPATVATQ